MEQLPQQLVNGIWQGAALALFAMGYTLVFGVLEIVNLAHGANYMWGAFIGFWLVTSAGWPVLWAGFLIFLLCVVGDWGAETGRSLVWLGCGVLLIGFVLDYRAVR